MQSLNPIDAESGDFSPEIKKLHVSLKRQQNERCHIFLAVLLEPQLPYLVPNLAGEHLAKFLSLLFSTRPSVLRSCVLPEQT